MTIILNIIGPIVFGIAFAGVLVFLKRVLRLPVPGWSVPMGAALAMMAAHLYNGYTWYDRFRAELPESVTIVNILPTSRMLEPWTYLIPRIDRFTAIDSNSLHINEALPDMVIGEILLIERYAPTAKVAQIADCAGNRTADLPADPAFGTDGLPLGLNWISRPADHPVLAAMCRLAAAKSGG